MSGTHRTLRTATVLTLVALLAACASRPPARDGPEANPPSGLERTPDAEPRIEPLRVGGPNKPYEVLGESYTPVTTDRPMRERGGASWYGRKFHGRPTASGEIYDMYAMTAAHKTMPLPSYARVRNPANGREIIVRVNDRGPFSPGRVIDLSYTAALKLGVLNGVAPVEVQRITFAEIRAGVASAAAPADDLVAAERPAATAGFWLQLGAFRQQDAALQLQQRLQRDDSGLAVAVFEDDALFRVQAGPWPTRAQAQAVADRLRSQWDLATLVLERR
jgi:rare lipoprotein A